MKLLSLIFLCLVAASSALAAYDDALPDPAEEARARALFRELRCVVCQGQSIDESNAPLAEDLRGIVREMIAEGQSDEQIKDFLVERYGVFVLMQPPVRGDTYLLWFGPALLLFIGAGFIFLTVRRAKRRAEIEAVPTASSRSDTEE